jgi:hypothetical protein
MQIVREEFHQTFSVPPVRQRLERFTFVCMSSRLPAKNLQKLNWILSLMIAVIFFIFVFAGAHDVLVACYRFLQSLVFTIVLTFGNLMLLSCFVERNRQREFKIKKAFYLCSYLLAALDFLLVKFLYSAFTGLPGGR